MLLEKSAVVPLLRCPKTGGELERVDDTLVTNTSEAHREYKIVDGYPVLVDFDSSVLTRDAIDTVSSVIERQSYSGSAGFVKGLVSAPQESTRENVQHIMKLLLESSDSARVLIVGGGSIGESMDAFYSDSRIELVSFDIYASPNVQFVADAHRIPLPDQVFDAVIIQAVLEHVLDPIIVVAQIYRVLKPRGIVYAETPFLQHVHEGAYDFTRYTESGHRYLFKRFELIESGVSAGAGTQLLWSIDNFFRGLFRSRTMGKIAKLGFFWLRYLDKLIPESYNVDAASGVFFLGRKQESAISAREAISHYKGAQS